MNLLRRRWFTKGLPHVTLMIFLLGLVTLLFWLPWEGPGAGQAQGGGDPPPCGTERWSVKTGTDPDAAYLDLWDVFYTSVTEMGQWSRPGTIPANNRVDPYEFYMFQVDATLVEFKRETDGDYHLVLVDDQGNSMVAEIPDPRCVGDSSPLKDSITNARAEFDAVFNVTTSFQFAYVPVTVLGIPFWDFNHAQIGRAPNIIEFHPVLDIQFD